MIMIRSNTTQRAGKPPPPIPPRPSKSVVAEALAKSRHINKVDSIREAAKTKSPARHAPPPPVSTANEIVKSKCTYSVNLTLKKPPVYDRSISEEIKTNTRPVIYHSSNVNNKVQITRKNSDVKIVNSAENIHNKDGVKIVRRESLNETDHANHDRSNALHLSRNNSVTRDCLPRERLLEKYIDNKEAKCDQWKTNSNALEKSCKLPDNGGETTYDSANGTLDKSWDQMLHDRNHVNTLIDEMFASVLEVQFTDESGVQNSTDADISQEQAHVNGTARSANNENARVDNSVTVNNVDTSLSTVQAPKTVIVIKNDSSSMDEQREEKKESEPVSNSSSLEKGKQVKFKDQMNHELLIKELECMKHDQEKIMKRQRKPSMDIYDKGEVPNSENASMIHRPDWLDVESGEVKLNTCQIIIDHDGDTDGKKELSLDYERLTKMSSLHGLPPLPKSLSGFSLLENHQGGASNPPTPMRSSSIRSAGQIPPGHLVYPPHPKVNGAGPDVNIPQAGGTSGRKSTNLDTQLAILRREMYGLRQLDLSLLSQLWSLNESIQDFRQILQDQEDRVLSPPSPSPAPSSGEEEADGDEFYMSTSSMSFRPVPTPPAARRPSSSSNASSLG